MLISFIAGLLPLNLLGNVIVFRLGLSIPLKGKIYCEENHNVLERNLQYIDLKFSIFLQLASLKKRYLNIFTSNTYTKIHNKSLLKLLFTCCRVSFDKYMTVTRHMYKEGITFIRNRLTFCIKMFINAC